MLYRHIKAVGLVLVTVGALLAIVLLTTGQPAHPVRTSIVPLQSAGGNTTPASDGPSGPISQGESVPPATGNVNPTQSASTPITSSAQAVALATSDTEEFQNVTKSEAVETTWAKYTAASGVLANGGPVSTLQVSANESVWVVAVSGTVVPEFAHGQKFPWGVLVYDAATDSVLNMTAGPSGSWPAWYSQLSS